MYICYCPLRDFIWNKNIVLYCIVLYCIVLYCIVLYCIVLCMSVKNPLGLVLYCYLNMPTINKAYLILSYLIKKQNKTGIKTEIRSVNVQVPIVLISKIYYPLHMTAQYRDVTIHFTI